MRPAWLLVLPLAAACATASGHSAGQTPAPASPESTSVIRPQYPSTYHRHVNPPVVIQNATIMTATGLEIPSGSILFRDGRIVAVGPTVEAPAGAVVVDGTGST